MQTVRTIADLRAQASAWRQGGGRVGLVPTMGGLHEGHLSLVRLAREHADHVIATLFVNPAQFAPNEDFDAYPRDEAADGDAFSNAGAELLFAPDIAEVYPPGHVTQVSVPGLSEVLDGAFRPHFFGGVATIAAKLLIQAMADVAVFGEKDYQQLQVIKRMARDLDIPTEILGAPTIREADGLAMSSRNRYLTEDERAAAPTIFAVLQEITDGVRGGVGADDLCAIGRARLLDVGFRDVDYVSVVDAETLQPATDASRPARALAAAWLGKARLIDNLPV
ncbi:MAG: pantoate--beta-alanine ligase [Rhodospirillaceae bacterium]|jgi:pantoate--beta-alanine ligase|nr:pantoate--beta-alanine ligase [Rhodospirillaceae bacterium]MBT5298960.1 pantoate--beta-alanine ligase [Rhodospirillaceae bacterium]MBT6608911.1 pantoate--beta-alanine ligase [Rhodospirillaceae bacterium]MBT6885485.1 pantoate--beta-alanine ligase [Rhodospirillaceae bacterium]MBT7251191.1 pantoate--beta-alanine ligase [Rhodospirillaceae bacterium]